jgi:hypothetical protein
MRSDRQPVATGGNGFGLSEPFSGLSHLPLVATGCDRLAPLMLHPETRIADVERLRRTLRARDLRMTRSL